jgi:TetR/AcrR family transcriptional regulator, regulator of autoinduction and epiphytic fitness
VSSQSVVNGGVDGGVARADGGAADRAVGGALDGRVDRAVDGGVDGAVDGGVDGAVDGRVRRGEANRQAIVDALLSLTAEMGAMPTATAIAERAGVAKRSIFHHFPDMEAVLAEAGRTQLERHWNVLQVPASGGAAPAPLVERLGSAMDQRAQLFEAIGDVRRVAVRYEQGSPAQAERLRQSRAMLRRHLRQSLEPEFSAAPRAVQDGIQAIASWETWEVLRRHQRLSVSAAKTAVQSTIEAALERA